MKNQKGITLMILISTVVIMTIITGTIAYRSIASTRMRSYYNMCADIELLDEKIALYYLENKALPISTQTKQISELISNYGESNPNYNPNNSEDGILYQIDLSKLKNLSLKTTEYYIDKTSHTIYCSRGKKVGNDYYFTVPLDYDEVDLSFYQ